MPDVIPIVYVVEDDISIREALEALIREAGWQPLAFSTALEYLAHPRLACPSCLILDVSLPGQSGLELQQQIADERSDLPIIFISGYADVRLTARAMKAGAVDFLAKPFGEEALLQAVRGALGRSASTMDAAADMKALRDRYASLSGREREVMALVVSGLMNKQVGGRLGISEITVKAHRGRVMRKMKAGSLADLVNMGARLGIPP